MENKEQKTILRKEKHTSEIVQSFWYRLVQRRQFLWNQIDEIDDKWESFGDVPTDENDYIILRVLENELDKVKELIKMIRKHTN